MEELFKTVAKYIALAVEIVAVILISLGALEAIFRTICSTIRTFQETKISDLLRAEPSTVHRSLVSREETWRKFGGWLLLGLEFELGADIIRTAISPGWREIGQLAAIAAIRTFLNYFLEKDVEKVISPSQQKEDQPASGEVVAVTLNRAA